MSDNPVKRGDMAIFVVREEDSELLP